LLLKVLGKLPRYSPVDGTQEGAWDLENYGKCFFNKDHLYVIRARLAFSITDIVQLNGQSTYLPKK
jgi:hypothetical protein